jgi:hypothetical protein
VHGDVTAFVFLAVLFAAGAVVTGLLHLRKAAISARLTGAQAPTAQPSPGA